MTEDEYERQASAMFRELAADGDPKAQQIVDALDRGSTVIDLLKRGIEATMIDIIEGRADPRQADPRSVRIMAEQIAAERRMADTIRRAGCRRSAQPPVVETPPR